MPDVEAVVSALNDPIKSGSYNMRVLRTLLQAERVNEWLTVGQIAERSRIPESAVGSRIRDLRTQGFIIKRVREHGLWVYRVFYWVLFGAPENQ